MKLTFRAKDLPLSGELRSFATTKLRRALSAFEASVRDVAVSFRDINGPKGGEDISCRIEARVRGGTYLTVEEIRSSPFAAASRAAERLARRVQRSLERRRARRRRNGWAAAVLGLLATGCSAVRVHSHSDLAPTVAIETYAWLDEAEEGDALDAEVRAAIGLQLATLGIGPAFADDASVLVSYSTDVRTRERVNDPYFDVYARERYELGTLTVRLHDPVTHRVVWRGSGESELRVVAVQAGPFDQDLATRERPRNWRVPTKVAVIFERLERDLRARAPATSRVRLVAR